MQVSNGRQRCTGNAAVCACPLFIAPKNFVYAKDLIVKIPPVSVFCPPSVSWLSEYLNIWAKRRQNPNCTENLITGGVKDALVLTELHKRHTNSLAITMNKSTTVQCHI